MLPYQILSEIPPCQPMYQTIPVTIDDCHYLFGDLLNFFAICRDQWQTIECSQLSVNPLIVLYALFSLVYGHFNPVPNSPFNFLDLDIKHYPLDCNLSTIELNFVAQLWSLLKGIQKCDLIDVFWRYGVPDIVEWAVYLWLRTTLEGITVCLASAEHFVDDPSSGRLATAVVATDHQKGGYPLKFSGLHFIMIIIEGQIRCP